MRSRGVNVRPVNFKCGREEDEVLLIKKSVLNLEFQRC